ncbi:MAG: hypothetical protein V4438_02520 [Patescibacteria group bacterium]
MRKIAKKTGFTLLFASLVGALVLAVGAAILSITLKQLTLSSAGKATQQSFYSADAGVECALYLDRGAGQPGCQLGFFAAPSTTPSGYASCLDDYPQYKTERKIRCMGKEIAINPGDPNGAPKKEANGDMTNDFIIEKDSPLSGDSADNDDMCLVVTVTKRASDGSTIIESRGYNTCNTSAANRYERAIRSINQ